MALPAPTLGFTITTRPSFPGIDKGSVGGKAWLAEIADLRPHPAGSSEFPPGSHRAGDKFG